MPVYLEDTISFDAELKENFFKLMIGRISGFDRCSSSPLLSVQLESLDTKVVKRALGNCQTSGQGLAHFLHPFIVDLVKRKLSLDIILIVLMKAHNEQESEPGLPDFILDLTIKDLFIAALEVTPEKLKSKLAYQYVGLGCPFPFYYELCDLESNIRSVTNFSSLEDLLLVPNPRLVLSCGTASAVSCGKTSLLQKIIGTMSDSSVDVALFDENRSESPCHAPSADLVFEKTTTYADFHGYTGSVDFLRALSMLAIVSSLSLVHVTESDIDKSKGVLKDEVRQYLANTFSEARRSPIIVIVRDSARSAFCAPVQKDLKELLQNQKVTVVNFPNLLVFRNEKRQYGAIKELTKVLEPYLTVTSAKASESQRLPPLENLKKTYSQLSKMLPVTKVEGISLLGRRLLNTLNAFPRESEKLASLVFPLANNKTRFAQAKKEEKSIRESIAAADGKYTEEDLARNMSKQKEIEGQSYTCQITEPVKLFASIIKEQKTKRLVEFQQYLEMWKHDDVRTLYNKRREVLKQIEETKKGSGDAETLSILTKTVKEIGEKLDELDISIDTFWSEIMQLCDAQQSNADKGLESSTGVKRERRLEDQCGLDVKIAKNVYLDCVLDGYPMQLLQGNPLQMAGAFLKDVIASVDIDLAEQEKLFVVSVIGAQSSAKSTLLNYLFGCGFSTRSGRCTKGLYVSYMKTSSGQGLLILDSEGLLSIEGAGRVFDGQITIMAMACSHVVIINHKGEISSELKDLLEVCLNAMSHLEITPMKPKLAFVLRDQRDRDVDVQTTSLQKLKSMLKEASERSNMHFEKLVNIDDACIFLLPSAFSEIPKGDKSVEVPSAVFSQEIFELRKKIFSLAQEGSRMMNFVSPGKETGNALVDWYNHAALIWSTLTNFGYSLLHYKTLEEIQINKDLTDIFNLVFANVFENEESGYKVKAERYLTELKQELDAVEDPHGVEKRHSSFKSKLNQLKDSVQRELGHSFKSQSSAERFKHLRPSFLLKFQSPLDREHDLYLFSAQVRVDQKTTRLGMASIDQHFLQATEEILKESRYKTGMSPEKALDFFEKRWTPLQEEFENKLSKNFPKDMEIRRIVIQAFSEEVNSMQHNEKYILLIGAQTPSYEKEIVNFQAWQDKEWMQFAMKNRSVSGWLKNWWKNRKYEVEALVAVKEMRSKVNNVVEELMIMLKHQDFGNLVCRSALEMTVASVEYLENKSLEKHGLILARAEFIDKFNRCLQAVTIDELLRQKRDELRHQRVVMARKKAEKREEFLTIVSTNSTDLERAELFVKQYCQSLLSLTEKKILSLRDKIRGSITKLFGSDEKQAAKYAYSVSFGQLNYKNVIKYCLDVNRFLRKIFTDRYEREAEVLLLDEKAGLEVYISKHFDCLQVAAKEWLKTFCDQSSSVELRNFSTFLEEQSHTAYESEFYRSCYTCFPKQANYLVRPAFVNAFKELLDEEKTPFKRRVLSDLLTRQLREERDALWQMLRGCSAECPLCGSKCEGRLGHSEPHFVAEIHHVFPAFGNSSTSDDDGNFYPKLELCLNEEKTHRRRWRQGHDGVWQPSLDAFLAKYYDRWRPFQPNPRYSEPSENLKKCWVNCRKALLPRFKMVDRLPDGWEIHSEPSKEIRPEDVDKILAELRTDDY